MNKEQKKKKNEGKLCYVRIFTIAMSLLQLPLEPPCSITTADMNLDTNVPISSSIDSVDVDSSCVRVEVNSEEVKHKKIY